MSLPSLSARTIRFVNLAHAFDHFVLLIYPTAVIAIAAQQGLSYGELIGLSTGTFVAFGLFALPAGWLADRIGRRNLLAVFFMGSGASCLGVATATSPLSFALWLTLLGVFAAIYHPVGSAMLVSHTRRLGRDLGLNGVWGNIGAASASGVTAYLTTSFGWQAAFIVPGIVCILAGLAFLWIVEGDGDTLKKARANDGETGKFSGWKLLAFCFVLAIFAGGVTFNVMTIALPKVIDERLGGVLPLTLTGSVATGVFALGALTQLTVGRLVDRVALPHLFVSLAILQPVGLGLAAMLTGVPMLIGLMLVMAAIYGQVVVNDAMIARYVPASLRSKAFGLRYFLGFAASGFAVPMISVFHQHGGFPLVLAITALFGALIFAGALGFLLISRQVLPRHAVPAE